MKKLLTRYWFEFKHEDGEFPQHPAIGIGCGITAYHADQALDMLEQIVFKDYPVPEITKQVENIDIRELDQNHVIPNMSDCTRLGIWFPLGYRSD